MSSNLSDHNKIEPLTATNYTQWEQEMSAWLCQKGWWRVVKGESA